MPTGSAINPGDLTAHAVTALAAPIMRPGSHLLVLPAPMTMRKGVLCLETQACDGVRQWAEHFKFLTLASPCVPEKLAAERACSYWTPVASLRLGERVRFVPLPWAYTVRGFVREFDRTRAHLRELIEQSQYLQFAIGGAVGDWPSVAAEQARGMRRAYAIHVDSVATELAWTAATTLPRKIKAMLHVPVIRAWERRLIGGAKLLLCNGEATFEAYHHLNPSSRTVYSVAIHANDTATGKQVRQKLRTLEGDGPLRVVYAGRMASEKAPLQWVRAIGRAVRQGANIEATWLGDGEMLEAMRREIASLGLEKVIQLRGFVSDRGELLEALRSGHVLAFTHLIRESPRILAEALVSATPIVGYDSAYARGLTSRNGGGRFVPVGDTAGLAKLLVELDCHRAEVGRLIECARRDGSGLTAEVMFKYRAELLKRFL